jgi:hypothetical protein
MPARRPPPRHSDLSAASDDYMAMSACDRAYRAEQGSAFAGIKAVMAKDNS